MNRALCLALLLACGADETSETERSESERTGESEATEGSAAEGETAATEATPRPNRSAGPARAGFEVVPQRMHRRQVSTITIFGTHAAAGTERGMVTIFDVPSGHVRAARRLFFGAVGELRVSDDRKRILALGSGTGEDDAAVEAVVWDLELDRVWPVPNEYAYLRAMSPDGRWVATIPAQTAEEPIEVLLSEVWGETRRRRFEELVGDLFFSHDSRTLYLVGDAGVQRLGLPGLRRRGEPFADVAGSVVAQHPTEELVALANNTRVSVHALSDGETKAELTAPDRVRSLQWSPDGSRLAAHGRRGRIFSGEGWATTQDFASPMRSMLDLVSEVPASLQGTRGKLVYTPVEGDPIELEPDIHRGVAFPPRAGWSSTATRATSTSPTSRASALDAWSAEAPASGRPGARPPTTTRSRCVGGVGAIASGKR